MPKAGLTVCFNVCVCVCVRRRDVSFLSHSHL